jgi:hypothetical protein
MSDVPAETPPTAPATAPELDVSPPAPPLEPAPLAPEPAAPAPDAATVPAADNSVLEDLLGELRELKAKIVAAIGG